MVNWLFCLVAAVLVFYIYLGYKRGLVGILLSMLVLLGSAMLTTVVAPKLNDYVINKTPLYESVEQGVYDGIKKNNVVANAIEQVSEESGATDLGELNASDLGLGFDTMVSNIMEKVNLPDSWKTKIMEANVSESAAESIVNATNKLEDVISAFIAVRIAMLVCSCISYVITFALMYIVMSIIAKILFNVSELPGISTVNRVGGMLIGLLQGLLIVWVFFVVMTMLYSTGLGQSVVACVDENPMLRLLYDNNIIMKALMGLSF